MSLLHLVTDLCKKESWVGHDIIILWFCVGGSSVPYAAITTSHTALMVLRSLAACICSHLDTVNDLLLSAILESSLML